ncbi:VanZ family protein [Agromyces sp. LHK192]|uniref:VanZ family protein n=1 Tax=Agromyces sp. LHK192 TaxID=2498704 RepID=UPI001F0C8DE2|nr:VanZ family protein [Agromyces sp. LHK192]
MHDQLLLGILAIAIGVGVGLLAFVPYVAIAYRRHGRLTAWRVLVPFAMLVYGIAVWTYTLLPLPDPDEIERCAGVNLNPGEFVPEIAGAIGRGHPLTDPAVLQLALNVLLFVPLGVFVRLLWRRGVVVSLLAGLGLSLLIELTQLTGVWGLYPCAYRVFDVDDLLTNTLGAVIGSLLSLTLPASWRLSAADASAAAHPTPVTRARRVLAMVVDAMSVLFITATVQLATVGVVVLLFDGDPTPEFLAAVALVAPAIPFVITAIPALVAGRTIGDAAVRLQYTGSRYPTWAARLLRFLGGIGGIQLLAAFTGSSGWYSLALIASLVATLASTGGRGFPGLLSGQRVADARKPSQVEYRES